MMSSFDDIKSVIIMVINNEIVIQYVNDILACTIYDVLKKVVIGIWKKLIRNFIQAKMLKRKTLHLE